jgi:serine/threonine protein kinase
MPGVTDRQPSAEDLLHLQEIASRFEKAAREDGRSVWQVSLNQFLPPPGDPLRVAALRRLIAVDLEIHWGRGQGRHLESYLSRYPELGSPRSLSLDLVVLEYRLRHQFGDRPALELYQTRFPDLFPQLQALIQEQPGIHTLLDPLGGPPTIDNPSVPSDLAPPKDLSSTSVPSPSPRPPSSGSAPPKAPTPSALLSVVGDYRLLEKLGQGMFGQVWKAEAPGGIEVAIKVISRPIDECDAQQELQALEHVKGLHHPYLVQTQAYWIVGEYLHIVMDLADGSLQDRRKKCREQGLPGIPRDELVRYLTQAAEGLDFLHSHSILHRDIKPANILLLQGYARLADFGLARPLPAQSSLASAPVTGTPMYMAPEVWESQVSFHSDQWSLAATYAELRLGRPLFKARDQFGIRREICQGPPDLTGLDEPERGLLSKALAMSAADRYPTCKEFARTLQEALCPPTSSGERLAMALSGESPGPVPASRRMLRLLQAAVFLLTGLLALVLVALLLGWIVPTKSSVAGSEETVGSVIPPPPQIEVEDLVRVTVDLGREKTFPLQVRRNFSGPVRIAALDADLARYHLSLPPLELAEGEDQALLRVSASERTAPGTHNVRLRVEGVGANREAAAPKTVLVELTVLFLPGGFEPEGGEVVEDGKGGKYYRRIAYLLDDGTRLPFVLIPKYGRGSSREDPTTFYIMENKVSLHDFRCFDAKHPRTQRQWQKDTNPQYPVFDVTVEDASAFAEWLGGKLPTEEQWDKAAGRYETPRLSEGPYRGKWVKGRTDIAFQREEPVAVGTADGDRSEPFGCRDMAGNGFEWTRTLLRGRGTVPLKGRLPTLEDLVLLRGRSFDSKYDWPLRYDDLDKEEKEDRPLGIGYQNTWPDLGFRVVIEQPES